jgi:DNA polymerase-1
VTIRNYEAITSIEALAERTERVIQDQKPFGYDIETGYLGSDRDKGAIHRSTAILVGISFTNSLDWARYVPLAHDAGGNLDNYQAAQLFWDMLSTGLGVAHNAAFELRHLSKWFLQELADDPERGEQVRASKGYFPIRSDSMVEAYLAADYPNFGLKFLTKEMFGHVQTELHELFSADLKVKNRKAIRFNTLELTPQVISYACEDSIWCLAIHQRYYDKVKDRLLFTVEKSIVQDVLPLMEDEGLVYDWTLMRRAADLLRDFRDRFNAEIMADLSDMSGAPVAINLASPLQVRKTLYEGLGMKTTVYTDKTRDLEPAKRVMSTSDLALKKLASQFPVVKKILQWREQTKLLGTYLDKYETAYNIADDGRAHPSLLSAFVITGRFACSDPNYQQSPRKYHFDLAEAKAAHEAGEEPPVGTCFKFNFRDAIKAPADHYILGFDLSQAELRAIAGEAQEHALLEAFENGDDVHRVTASLMLGVPLADVTEEQRGVGKMLNFALLYGMSTKGLADRLNISMEEAQSLMDKYFAGLSAIAAYMTKQVRIGKEKNYVTSRFGRKMPIWEYLSENPYIRSKGDRACVNYPIQGAATGDYMKIAMVRVVHALKKAGLLDKVKLVMNVHDALEFYVHKSLTPEEVIAVLKPAVVFDVPGWPTMKADWHVAKRWGSPVDIEVHDDGSVTTKGAKLEEIVPSIEIDEEGNEIVELPEVDEKTLREAARVGGRRVVITIEDMPTSEGWSQFKAFLARLPGGNRVSLVTPEGDIELPFETGLSASHLGAVSQLLPGARVEYVAEHVENLVGDLSF